MITHPYGPGQELMFLRADNERMRQELIRRERERIEAERKADEENRHAAESAERERQQQERESHLEERRRNAWLNHRVDKALASDNPDRALFELLNRPNDILMEAPSQGWPPGVCADDFRNVPLAYEPEEKPSGAFTNIAASTEPRKI